MGTAVPGVTRNAQAAASASATMSLVCCAKPLPPGTIERNSPVQPTADAYYDVPADDDTWCLECECNPCECDEDPAEPDWESEAELRAEMRSEDW